MYYILYDNVTHYDILRSDIMTIINSKQIYTYKNETKY